MSGGSVAAITGLPASEETRRFLRLTYTLAITEWKLRFFGSALGYLWTIARPLMLFGVLYVVFSQIADLGNSIPNYPVYLLTAIVLYTFFAEATGNAVTSLVDREALLRKIKFPRSVVPLSVCLTALFNLGMNLIAVMVFMLANGLYPTLRWLELPLFIIVLGMLASGLALLLSVLYVRFRDIAPIWDVVAQMLFYGSPIFYTVDMYKGFAQEMSWTPFVMILTQMRHALIDPSAPSAADVAGGYPYLLIPCGTVVAIFLLGIYVFQRASATLAENL